MAMATWRAHVLFGWTTPDVWGLTPLAWVLLDVALALVFAVLIVRPRPLTLLAFGFVLTALMFQFAMPILGRYTAGLTLLALFAAGAPAAALSGWPSPRPWRARLLAHRGRLFAIVFGLLALTTLAVCLLAWAHYEGPARTYHAVSPDGRWALVYIRGGDQNCFPSLDASRDVWGLFRDDRPVMGDNPPRAPRWIDNHTVEASGYKYDIWHLNGPRSEMWAIRSNPRINLTRPTARIVSSDRSPRRLCAMRWAEQRREVE